MINQYMYSFFIEPLQEKLENAGLSTQLQLLSPPSQELGDFCIVVNKFAGKQDPEELGKKLVEELNIQYIEKIEIFTIKNKKKGSIVYLNFLISADKKKELQKIHLEKSLEYVFSEKFAKLDINKGKKAIVEHTSANPISPLHVGNIRNSIQGDTFARILERTGYEVFRHFYVNDVGLQVSFVVIGYEICKEKNVKPVEKFDLWLGKVYAIMNCLYTIQNIKENRAELKLSDGYQLTDSDLSTIDKTINNELKICKKDEKMISDSEEEEKRKKKKLRPIKQKIKKLNEELSEAKKYHKNFKSLQRRFEKLFDVLYKGVTKINLKEKQSIYLKSYEKNSDKRIVDLFKEVTLWVLDAFVWTLERYNIHFDRFDFESELSWSGLPGEIIDKLADSEYTIKTDGEGIRLQYPKEAINKLLKETGMTKKDIPIRGNVPDLQLRRSNGTALYAAKDIAYSVKKFRDRNPEVIYNVISTEQSLPQFQLLLPLLELGYPEYARGLKHYAYELVELAGRPMSGRLASYVTADAFYDETYIRARMAKRASDGNRGIKPPKDEKGWTEEHEILHAVTLASTRYPMLDKNPNKKIVLDIDQELDFKRNQGPFIQYAHARCYGILQKAKLEKNLVPEVNSDMSEVVDDFTLSLVDHLASIDHVLRNCVQNTDPSNLANWCANLALKFMKFYENYPVMKAENEKIALARLTIIDAIRKGIATGLEILGIPAANRL